MALLFTCITETTSMFVVKIRKEFNNIWEFVPEKEGEVGDVSLFLDLVFVKMRKHVHRKVTIKFITTSSSLFTYVALVLFLIRCDSDVFYVICFS